MPQMHENMPVKQKLLGKLGITSIILPNYVDPSDLKFLLPAL